MTHNTQSQRHLERMSIINAWDALADGYNAYVTPKNAPLAETALGFIDLRPGTRFLDVAAGSGALSLAAARRGAEVLGIDISPAMIAGLNDNARREGLANLSGKVMDGHNLELDDNAFDASGSMFGVMLFPDFPRGLGEMARVTRPGGNVLVVTFGPPPNVEFLQFFLGAVKRVVPEFGGLPMDPPPLPFQVADPEKLGRVMRDAGLDDVRVETISAPQEYRSADELWTWMANSNPIGAQLTGHLPPKVAGRVREVLDDMIRERSGGDGPATLTNAVNIAVGIA